MVILSSNLQIKVTISTLNQRNSISMSQEMDSKDDDHEGVNFSDGFVVNSQPMSSENQARDVDFSEFQSEDNPKMSSWKVKNGSVKCAVNAPKEEAMEHFTNEANHVKASMLRIFIALKPDLFQVLQHFLGLSLTFKMCSRKK